MTKEIEKLASQKGYKGIVAQIGSTGDTIEFSLLQKWLRETHEVYVESLVKLHDIGNDTVIAYRYQVKEIRDFELVQVWADDNFPTYEKALEAALFQALNSLP